MLRPVAFILLVEMIKLTCIRVAKISISHLSETKFKEAHFEQIYLRNQPSQIQK